MIYQTFVLFGNVVKLAQVGRKKVINVLVADHSRSDKSELDCWQLNIFSKDEDQMKDPEVFREMMTALEKGSSMSNLEFTVQATMSKKYTNKKGEIVYPRPEFKLLAVNKKLNLDDFTIADPAQLAPKN